MRLQRVGREERVRLLRRLLARLVVLRDELGAAIAVDVGQDPRHVEQAVIGAIGDHAAELGVEAVDDRRGVRT